MVNVPEFNLNDPFTLNRHCAPDCEIRTRLHRSCLNQMWRNPCINDTYEPGSTFKIITAAAGLEAGVVTLNDTFSCPGFRIVEDRKIRCHKAGGHGGETFLQGMMNSCNPVLIDVGQRLGVDSYYKYFEQFGLIGKTGMDLPGEAATIMHKKENMGAGGAGNRVLRPVLPDYAAPADYHGLLHHQRGKPGDAPFRREGR